MAYLPSIKMMPTSVVLYAWYIVIVIVSLFATEHISNAQAWTQDIAPTLKIKYDQKWPVFFGNQSDYFQILDQDESSVLIGARNAMYNVSLKNLLENQSQRLEWESTPAHRELCTLKGKQDSDCQNYIRVFARIDDNKIMVCGTNSYKPLCRRYKNGQSVSLAASASHEDDSVEMEVSTTSENSTAALSSSTEIEIANASKGSLGETFEMIEEFDGQGRCPYNPTHNSSYIFTDGQLYSATAADFSGGDALIYRETQRTEQFNAKQLNQPSFVSTLERNGYVFFFFRELALENCGKTIYSRVARVCKNDRGGPSPFRERWTSYLKTRLNCSTPGDFPFYFDELQGTTSIIDGLYQTALNQKQQIRNYHTHSRAEDSEKSGQKGLKPSSLIYAVFTTPQNAIPGSAVCAFQIDDIIDTFEGNFKGQKDATSNWLPIPPSEVPEPRPGKCVDDSRDLPMRTVNFVKMHTLMESSVPALYGRPVLTRVTSKHRFTAIATDAQVEALNGDKYDIIFIGTDNGHVIKSIHYVRSASNDTKTNQNGSGEQQESDESTLETVVISETQAFSRSLPVKQMTVTKEQQSLVVIGTGIIVSIPIHHCGHKVSCRECLNLQDPYCVWDTKNHECTYIDTVSSHNRMNFLQNIRQSRKETIEMCGDDNENRIDAPVPLAKGRSLSTGNAATNLVTGSEKPVAQPSVLSTRGTVSSVGREPADLNDSKIPDNRENEVEHASQNGPHDGFGVSDNGFDNDDSETGVVVPRNFDAVHSSNSNQMRLASPIFATVVFIVFAVGLAFGFIMSKRFKFSQSPFDILRSGSGGSGSSHHHLSEHHRNQLNFYDKSTGGGRNASSCKDVNLLMNVMGPYIAAGGPNNVNGRSTLTNTGCQTPNNLDKKDILELEFETKDRSHECKNSTEHLDINDLKVNANNNTNCNNQTAPQAVIVNSTNTGTLQKVKKTYL
ncbi:semaphorin-1A [Sitodiplosis mosellana]|uniref:semaphorin-1A n=1 Tax=Sitodiplosis mosellana TaxID=263140 RepID=UPI002445089F|nr:semaphorin-1A [Sitodiplosis mosellana]XP_055317316.1 semaphorin-1A [Sitodiplosis mosellana]XP_055317317.1 semaphorin-1A [Sitodiplosis mosellana]XP_055317318.1 semaphorin-1A [Sitodiplosis mosellana]XP_055317319.1 semaphorin-1A [Sitodiplosis mosellana]